MIFCVVTSYARKSGTSVSEQAQVQEEQPIAGVQSQQQTKLSSEVVQRGKTLLKEAITLQKPAPQLVAQQLTTTGEQGKKKGFWDKVVDVADQINTSLQFSGKSYTFLENYQTENIEYTLEGAVVFNDKGKFERAGNLSFTYADETLGYITLLYQLSLSGSYVVDASNVNNKLLTQSVDVSTVKLEPMKTAETTEQVVALTIQLTNFLSMELKKIYNERAAYNILSVNNNEVVLQQGEQKITYRIK
ncbi:MAG: hypothetical protein LBR13_03565 [Dysgonamonadaceae bacterium]|nr:hypothetical protein [Dysgonamonadaceae bacterium]